MRWIWFTSYRAEDQRHWVTYSRWHHLYLPKPRLKPSSWDLKHLFILLPCVASCMFISWEFGSCTAVVSKGNTKPLPRSWTSKSFVRAFHNIYRAPTVCKAYSHRNKSVIKFRCYLQKTSRIQPHVPAPWSKYTSYVTCFIGQHALARVLCFLFST